jgi:hypothetical protein
LVTAEKAAKAEKEYQAAKAAEDWEVDVPEEDVGDVLKMFQAMAAGGAKVFMNKP